MKSYRSYWMRLLIACALAAQPLVAGAQRDARPDGDLSFAFRNAPIAELFEMLSRRERVNIMLSPGVTGNATVNLYDVSLRQAIHAIAESAGYGVEERAGAYLILDKKESAARLDLVNMEVKALRIQYSNPKAVAEIAAKYATRGGKVTLLEERRTLVVEDTPEVIARIERLLREIDRQPLQIMIEAKILEVTLDDSENFGVDWTRFFNSGAGSQGGTRGLADRNTPGLFFNIVNRNIEVHLNALSNKGRVHTLATPKLLTLENQEAVTNVGDKIGYRLTTTINNVSTESIQFLETGVILRVVPSVDVDGRISMKIRPEVSSGTVSGGIPSKKTTEVTTQLVAEDGQSILIAGLIKNSDGYRKTGVPVLGDLPIIGRAFSTSENLGIATETIVIITPRIVRSTIPDAIQAPSVKKVAETERALYEKRDKLEATLEQLETGGTPKP
jgi:type II secretory pathway component GspD/PulD (secretin)